MINEQQITSVWDMNNAVVSGSYSPAGVYEACHLRDPVDNLYHF